MHLSADIDEHGQGHPQAALASLTAYFETLSLSAEELNIFLHDRLGDGVDFYFVSTLVRGLGRFDERYRHHRDRAGFAEHDVVNGVLNGKRIGLKIIAAAELDEAFALLTLPGRRIAASDVVDRAILSEKPALKMADVERMVHGYSFRHGTRYLANLPSLGFWTMFENLRGANDALVLAGWADTSGQFDRATGYLNGLTIHILDAVLAFYGEVQSNTKWTFQRWAAFKRSGRAGVDGDMVRRVDALIAATAIFRRADHIRTTAAHC